MIRREILKYWFSCFDELSSDVDANIGEQFLSLSYV
jgi:hypothetical protein